MNEYIVDGKLYQVPDNLIQNFLEKYPNAQKKDVMDFQTPTTPGAVVEGTAAPDMDSNLEATSSESPGNKNELNKIALGNFIKNIPSPVGGVGAGIRLLAGYGKMWTSIAETAKGYAETKLRGYTDTFQMFQPEFTEEQQNNLINTVSENIFQPFVDTIGLKKITPQLQEAKEALDYATYEDVERTAYEEFFTEEGNFADGVKKIANGVVEAVPSVSAAFAGPAGYAALFGSAAGDAYTRKIDAGAEKGDLTAFSLSLAQGGVELVSEMVTRGIFKGFNGTILSKITPNAAKKFHKNLTKTITGRVFAGSQLEGLSEVGAQETVRFIDALWDDENVFGYRKNERYDNGDFKYDWGNILERSFDTYMISGIIGSGLGGASKTPSSKAYVSERLAPTTMKSENLLLAKQIAKLESEYNKEPSPIIEGQILKLKQQILNNKKLAEQTLEQFNDKELAEYATGKVALVQAKERLKTIKDPETKKLLENSIQAQEQILNEVYDTKKNQVIKSDVKKSTEFAESAESIGLETKVFQSTQDFETGIEADGIKLDDEQRSELGEVGGFISGNKIYINEQVAAETGNLNVGGHEVMHGVVTEKLKTLNPEQLQQLQKDFLELLPPTEKQLLQDALNERYDAKDHAKEFFSVFSDLSQNGDIKYNETVFTKIRDWLVEMIRRFTPYKKIEFNNAQDVYTFMREYTNSINKGRLSKGLAKGIGKVGPAEVALSKQASDNVQNIYNEKGIDGSFDIIEAFNPIINKLVDRRKDAPNFNKEDLTSEIKYSDRGILGLIRSYKPDSGIPLAAYVNKFLPSRMIEASNKILGEEFTLDVTEARGVIAQEAETVTEKPVSKKIKPSSLLKDIEAAKSKIMKGLKNVPEKDLTFKRLKDLSPETTAEIFEVPVKKVTDPKANLNKGDLSNAARNINKNADKLLRLLPKGAVVEAASEKLLGTSTGVPKSLLDVFYTKQERLTRGAGLSPYKLNSINRQQFLEGLGIVDGKLREGLSPRSPEAQRIKGIMNLTGKLITNEIVRSEGDLSPEQKQNVAAGKQDIMFSKKVKNDYRSKPGDIAAKVDVKLPPTIQIQKDIEKEKLYTVIDLDANFTETETVAEARNRIANRFIKQNPKYRGLLRTTMSGGITISTFQTTPEFDLAVPANKENQIESPRFVYNTKKFLNPKSLEKIKSKQFKLDQSKKLPLLKDFFVAIQNYLNDNNGANKKDIWFFEQMIKDTSNNQNSIVRILAPFKFYPIDANGNPIFDQKVVEEHTDPQVQIGRGLLAAALEGKVEERFKVIGKSYMQGSLLEVDDIALKDEGLASDMPDVYFDEIIPRIKSGKLKLPDGMASVVRLAAANINLNNYKLVDSNQTIAEFFGVGLKNANAEQIKLQNELIIDQLTGKITNAKAKELMSSMQELNQKSDKVAKKNVDILKGKNKIQAFSKKKKPNNNEVINKLQEIDKANIEASKTRTAKIDINKEFNQYLESATGIGAAKVFNQAKAEARGSKVRKSFGDYFIPPGAEDFGGLMHKTLAKGKKGEKQLEFYKKYLYDPYNAAMESITREKSAMMNDFMALKKQFSNVPKRLKKFTKGGDYTNDQAVRVYAWTRQGMEIPGLSKKDIRELVNEVKNDKELLAFATELINITKGDGYPKPQESWVGGNVAIDLMSLLNGDKRSKHLEAWQNNVDILFSKENMFKLEAAYGKNWVKNVKATLERMKNGSNRKWGGDKNIQAWNDWVNGSVGTIMFLNTRSAVLQMISNVNYINYKDNNPLKAAQAFANQPQYWSDFVEIFNSDYLQERRGGNKININESELALAAEKGGVQGTISYLLNKGFILTKMADSFAISSGGATFYRNRIKTYIKDGMSETDAKKQAFLDFKAITEETQQSSRPDRISEQQASGLGRFMLAFANTPMQYNRIIKRNAQDLFARRGDPKEKMSKILYYSTIQNFIFNAMSKAVFALAFADDDDDEKVVSKAAQVGEGMAESLLRGSGLTGNAVVAVKNVVKELAKQAGKPNPKFEDVVLKGFTVSPPLYGKVTRLRGAGYAMKYVTPENIFEPKLDNPALSAAAQTASATFNFPLDRALRKAQNIEAAMSNEPEWWQRAALLAGWGSWELGMENEKDKKEKRVKKPSGRKEIVRKEIIRK